MGLCPTAGSRPPSTPPTTSTVLSLRSATRASLSTPLSPLRDTVMLPPLLPMLLLPQCTSPLLKSNGANIQTFKTKSFPPSYHNPEREASDGFGKFCCLIRFSSIFNGLQPPNPQPFHKHPPQETSPNLPFIPVFIYLLLNKTD